MAYDKIRNVQRGGTGVTSLTQYGVVVGQGTEDVTVTPAATNGQLLIGATGADPAFATLASSDGSISISPGANSLDITTAASVPDTFTTDSGNAIPALNVINVLGGTGMSTSGSGNTVTVTLTTPVTVANGGTGATTLTGVLTGNGTSAFTASAVTQYNVLVGAASNLITSIAPAATSGTPLISQGASADPAFGTAVVAGGGTGATSLTDGGILLGSGTGSVTVTSQPTNGQLLIGSTGVDPVLATLTAGTGVTITEGAGSITIDADNNGTVTSVSGTADRITIGGTAADPVVDIAATYAGQSSIVTIGTVTTGTWNADTVTVPYGGTGATTLTDGGILLGSGTGAVTVTSQPTNGQLLIGSTGVDPVLGTLTGGTGITITEGAGSITIDSDNVGDVVGPGSATDNAIARYDGTTGKLIQNSGVIIDDSNNVSGAISVQIDGAAGDPYVEWTTTGGQFYALGVDNDDTDNFKLTTDTSAVDPSSGTTIFEYDTSESAPISNFKFYESVRATRSTAGTAIRVSANHSDNTNAASNAALIAQVGGDSGGDPFVQWTITGANNYVMGIDNTDSNALVGSIGTAIGTSNFMRVKPEGEINYPLQSSFFAYLGTTDSNETGGGTTFILGDTDVGTALTEVWDQNGDFSTGSSSGAIFTAPVTGRYQFMGCITFLGITSAETQHIIQSLSSNRLVRLSAGNSFNMATAAGLVSANFACMVDMDAADTIDLKIQVSNGTDVVDINGSANANTYWCGQLIA